ncbi:hypothetical protein ABH313_05480 [Chromobacterium vaccinii]|uniref:hypothetical protein n=1 Tax=Chromobacterium vaccinii TaxID=1108595 RepID=UPI0032616C6B
MNWWGKPDFTIWIAYFACIFRADAGCAQFLEIVLISIGCVLFCGAVERAEPKAALGRPGGFLDFECG